MHDYREGTPDEKTFYTELWDVGGSVGSASSVKSTRAVFYNSVNGKYNVCEPTIMMFVVEILQYYNKRIIFDTFLCLTFFNTGIILVHDLTNKKSSQNLYRWSLEALNKDSSPTGIIVSNG